MKSFFLFISKILILTLILLVILDFTYTSIYSHSSKRSKVEQVYTSENKDYDVIILGSSRANNHFVAPLFEQKGLKTFNYGMSGGHLFEASLLLKLMVERNYKIKTVLLEADLNLSNEERAEGVSARFLPYIHQSKTIRDHFSKENDFRALYYIPFYRYVVFDARIGFREAYKTAIAATTNSLDHLGYYPLGNKKGNMKNNIANLKPLHNKYYEEIKQICKTNRINLIVVTTPMCSTVIGMDYFEKVIKMYPEIHNYEGVVQGDGYFSSCGHLNDAGAKKFTSIIISDFFTK
ncbi:hypothetical protein QLS91_13830 [Flavobacterium sp. LB2P84]|uniref:hypothetical protein n=1 Tax=Flavobacterium yafengii TaxID=3041253 RepID=UPI0024A90719|nr:hypothetical protein [Flavobacterium yafengii]MDI6034156.1 hypothetical protein [Flavobacterium yafengii]